MLRQICNRRTSAQGRVFAGNLEAALQGMRTSTAAAQELRSFVFRRVSGGAARRGSNDAGG
jgi:hypothetical protein